MPKWTKRRVANLQSTIENGRMNADHASRIALAIWEEWDFGKSVKNPSKGVTQEELESMLNSLTDAKIQIQMAIEELERFMA